MTRRRARWLAKRPHNRVHRLRDGRIVPVPEPQCLGTEQEDYTWVLEEYRNARHPRATAEEVIVFDPPRDWRERLVAFDEFYASDPPR